MSNYPWTHAFLRALAECGVISTAAKAAGITSAAVSARRKADPGFEELFNQALEDSIDLLDNAVRSRALHGVEEPVVYQGQLTPIWETDANGQVVLDIVTGNPVQARNPDGSPKWLTITKYSDALLMFALKGNRRRLYGDKTEVGGFNGGPIVMDETKKASRIAALLALARDRKDIA
jgi:hypothetical protein